MTHDRTANYHRFLEKVDPEKSYEIIKTVASKKALEILSVGKVEIPGEEILMNSYIDGIRKTMKDAKEMYDVFAQKVHIGLWSGIETPRVHMHEKGKIDLKDLILNSHKNRAFKKGGFNEVYLPPAKLLKEKDVSMLEIAGEWNTPGTLLRKINEFFYQQVEEDICCNSED